MTDVPFLLVYVTVCLSLYSPSFFALVGINHSTRLAKHPVHSLFSCELQICEKCATVIGMLL